MSDVESSCCAAALAPVEPPEALTDRLERGLTELTDAAADELADWELSAMRDPRNWVRPAAAVVVGGVAAGGLVLVRARQQQKKRQGTGPEGAGAQAARRGRRRREAPARLAGPGAAPPRSRRVPTAAIRGTPSRASRAEVPEESLPSSRGRQRLRG